MSMKIVLFTLLTSLYGLPAMADSYLTGKTYQIDIAQIGGPRYVRACLTFHNNGRLDFSQVASNMHWLPPYGALDRFVAASNTDLPANRPYNMGTHGVLISGNVLVGTTIDETGNSTGFLGSEVERCSLARPAATPTGTCLRSAAAHSGDAGRALVECAMLTYVDPAAQEYPFTQDCSGTHCAGSRSALAGRQFVLTMSDGRAAGECWSFDKEARLRVHGPTEMTWVPDYLGDTVNGFQAVTRGEKLPATFYGTLIDETMLDVRGIAVHEDGGRPLYGVGFEVQGCIGR